ncbi:hypothetical protein [Streptomyces pratensis]|uniref:hypothetical protein n=1 Tax=Streptomyces pratensis TaxID=1169025 RepID=UPI0030164DE2
MTQNVKIGTALVGGYLLGRTKKAKLAIGFGTFLLGRRFDLDPRRIGRMLADSPVMGSLNDQVRKELVDATRTAATKAVTQRAGGLADSLRRRTEALDGGAADGEPEEDAEEKDARSEDAAEDGNDADEARESGKRKRAPRRSAGSTSEPSSKRRSESSRTSAPPARKRASGARKARGGDDG